MLVSGGVLAIYFWVFIGGENDFSSMSLVSDLAAILAGIAYTSSLISYLWTPEKYATTVAFCNYLLLVALVVTLIISTGYLASPFIALWILVSVFAPIFSFLGAALVLSLVVGFIAYQLMLGSLSASDMFSIMLVAIIPLIIGLIILSQLRRSAEHKGESAYSQLASELSSIEGKSEVVIAAIADGVIALDKKGLIELINPAAQRMIGWGKADALNLDYKSVLKIYDTHDKSPDPANDPVNQALTTNQTIHTESMSIGTSDTNKKFLASITASPVGAADSGVIVVFRDITKEKIEEREQAEFISTASHEMRTPVASIEGYLGLALNPTIAQVDDKARDFITKAQVSAQHLGRLFQDLLDVSKVDDGRLNSTPKVIDIVQLTHDIALGLLSRAEQKNIHVNFKPQPDLYENEADKHNERILTPIYYAEVDNDHIREIISNLVENAIKYTPSGSIEIDVTGDDRHITVSIADSGIGIPQEDIPHLFQKFYRVDDTDTREIGGTGLGLYLSRKLVESMHGKIWVESTYQQGSTFYVQIPRLDNTVAKQKLAAIQSNAESKPSQQTQITDESPTASIANTVEQITNQETMDKQAIPTPPPRPPQSTYQRSIREAPTTNPTPRPTMAEMSPRTDPIPSTTSANQRQNIPISTIESNPSQFVRKPNDSQTDGGQ